MRKIIVLVVASLVAAAIAALGPAASVVEAGVPTSDLYLVHGLNLDGQQSQDEGGTPVTICEDENDTTAIIDFEFGDVLGPASVPTGQVTAQVYAGAGVDCANPGAEPIIDQALDIPSGTVALIATAGPQTEPELLVVPLDTACADPGTGRLTAVHAAAAGTVDVLVDGEPAGQLSYGQSLDADLPAGTYSVQVNLGNTPIVDPADIPVDENVNRIVYVVGNQPGEGTTPVVPLISDIPIDVCEQPTPEPEPAAPTAGVIEARPTFTG